MPELFISYSRKDIEFGRRLHDSLIELNRQVWMDLSDIPPGAQFRSEIFNGIEQADNFVFLISPDSANSTMCREEIGHAIANNKRLLAVVCRSVRYEDVPPAIGEIEWIDGSKLGLEQTLQQLITAIDTDLDWVRRHTHLLLRARGWEAGGRDEGFLLHGTELREAVRWLERAPTLKERRPTVLHERYIGASEKWESGEIQRQTELKEKAEKAQREAVARERVAFSTLSLSEDPERSILLAMHAVNATRAVDGTVLPEVEDALHRAISLSRLRFTLHGHSGSVSAVALSTDGALAVSASDDGTLKVWDLRDGRELRTMECFSPTVQTVAVSSDGHLAISGCLDQLKVWDVESGQELRTLFPRSAISAVVMSRDGRVAISAFKDGTLKVWDLVAGQELQTLRGHTAQVYGVGLSADGRCAVSASADNTLKVWDVENGFELHTLHGHSDYVCAVAVSADGTRAVSGSVDKTLKVWDVQSGSQLRSLSGHSDEFYGVALTADGRHLISASSERTLKLWDVGTGRERLTLRGHASPVLGVAISADGASAISASMDQTLKVWDVKAAASYPRSLGLSGLC